MVRNTKIWVSVIIENRFIITVVLVILFVISCISPFVPDYKGEDNMFVVDGGLIKGNKTQVIILSRSSSILSQKYSYLQLQPVEYCQVRIVDDSGNEFNFTEKSKGRYESDIEDALLNYNARYKLLITTPSGENYESDYQSIMETAPIDSIYYNLEIHNKPELNETNLEGIQFYVDLNAPDNASRYYKWQIEETWELRASSKISGIYDGKNVKVDVWPSDSLYFCWKTRTVPGIYTSSTTALTHNIVKQIPLHFKELTLPEFGIKYCATVRQYALSKDAYEYWNQKESELFESGQLYTTQPNQLKSNIFNTGNPDEKVLGYFWVTSCTLKRLFLEHPFGATPEEADNCKIITLCTDLIGAPLEAALLANINNYKSRNSNFPKPPVYIYFTSPNCYSVALTSLCIDCRLMTKFTKPTNKKPDFWQ